MHELRTEILIHASPGRVWQVITGLEKWPEWNPFIHHAIGKAEMGAKVDITVTSPGKDMLLHCVVTRLEPEHLLAWKYHVGLPLLFEGEHFFSIEPAGDDQVRFIDREVVTGLLVPTQVKNIDTNSRRGFESMDQALKARAENGAAAG